MPLFRIVLLAFLSFYEMLLPASADPLLDTVLAQVRADQGQIWSMNRTGYEFNSNGSVKSKKVAQFDDSKPADARWSLTSIDGRAPGAQDDKAFHTLFRDNPFPPTYGAIANFIDADAMRLSEAAGQVKYRWKTMPARTTLIRGHDFSEYLSGELTIDTSVEHPFIKELRIYAAEPFRPVIGVKVEHLERVMHFAMNVQGQLVMTEALSSGDGNAFFVPIRIHAQSVFSGHKAHMLVASRVGGAARR